MITVYSKDGCGYCTKIKKILKDYKVEHKALELDQDYTIQEVKDLVSEAKGEEITRMTFPAIFHDDSFVGGCDDMMDYMLEHKLL